MGILFTGVQGNILTTLMGNVLTEGMGKVLDIYTLLNSGSVESTIIPTKTTAISLPDTITIITK